MLLRLIDQLIDELEKTIPKENTSVFSGYEIEAIHTIEQLEQLRDIILVRIGGDKNEKK